jgi:U3 small nucleolar RNA-associated protein 10
MVKILVSGHISHVTGLLELMVILVKLQYLDRNDYRKYLRALTGHRDHLVADPSYIKVFHQQHLGRDKSDKKKEAEYVIHVWPTWLVNIISLQV